MVMGTVMSDGSTSGLQVYRGLKAAGINLVTSVPCIKLRSVLTMLSDDPDIMHVPVTREEEGVGICAGAFLGGMKPALLMQNSGLGNCVNALASLDLLYGLPILLIISHRGTMGEPVGAQVPMGQATVPLLNVLEIAHLCPSPSEGEGAVYDAAMMAFGSRRPAAVLFDLEFWKG
jgi:sulfopyruvate decarboxylase subunit alpha